jgi:hypothetical protein
MFRGWTNGERLFVVTLTFAVVLVAFCSLTTPFGHGYSDTANHQSYQVPVGIPESNASFIWNRDAPQWLAGLGGFLSALVTAALIWLTYETWQSANRANTTADRALINSITSERGWLQVLDVSTGMMNGAEVVMFRTQNIGRTPIRINGEDIRAYYLTPEANNALLDRNQMLSNVFRLLKADGSIVTWLEEGALFRPPIELPVVTEDVMRNTPVVIKGMYTYQTAFGTTHRYGFSMARLSENDTFNVLNGELENFDIPEPIQAQG